MDELISADIGIMLQTIENDINMRIQEINLETDRIYSELKKRYEDEIAAYEREESARIAWIFETKRKQEISRLKRELSVSVQKMKSRKIRSIISKVKERVAEVPLCISLVENCFSEVSKYECVAKEELEVYCVKRDEDDLRKVISNTCYEMPGERLGGIIAVSKKEKNIYDNSYLTRINLLVEKRFDLFYDYFSAIS